MPAVNGTTRFGLLVLLLAFAGARSAVAQEGSSIPSNYRGTQESIARGVLDGNLIETNYRNHGELSRWDDNPWGVWPKEVGGRHIDGVGVVVAGLVRGERAKWSVSPYNFWRPGTADTLISPVSLNYRGAGLRTGPYGDIWGWLPLSGFHNTLRRNPTTGSREPVPALSTDPSSWPAFWPDKLQEPDPGWANDDVDENPNTAAWNGMFGKGVLNADQESFYVIDDFADRNYVIDPVVGGPFSPFGVFYPNSRDSTQAGLGLQIWVRLLQWSNILAEDTMFLIYRITNMGDTNYGECIDFPVRPANALPLELDECPGNMVKTGLFFTQFVDFGLGNEEGDETAAFNPQLDIAFGFDHDGIGQHQTGGVYDLGYTGFAFLESPANGVDNLDNDEDGITDEQRFGGPGQRIEGQANIRAYVEANYNVQNFTRFNGLNDQTFEEVLNDRPAYRKGVWWTGDENLDWVGFDDLNGNGIIDPGELVNDDYGRDGLGPYDPGYPGPDQGEGDGIPTIREPNFDETDVDESDQIGLTGFHLGTRPFYEAGDNLREDRWMWDRIRENQFPLGQKPEQQVAGVEPFLNFSSGPVNLLPNRTDFFSTAWIFGEDEQDFFKNRQTVQNIYNADYRFAQPPIVPTLKAEAGDGYVVLSWDTLSLSSYDRFTQEFDFEGYKLYKGTDPVLSDARTITDVNGIAQFYKPIARWDLANGIRGTIPVLDNTAFYDRGSDTGLQFSYIDRDVTNGKTYYYALVAYDRGFVPGPDSPDPNAPAVDPQENTFNARNRTQNVAVVTPRSRAAGYIGASTNEDLSRPTEGIGTGSIEVTVVNSASIQTDAVYRLAFFDSTRTLQDLYETTAYELRNLTTNQVLIPRTPLTDTLTTSPAVDGFVIDIHNVLAGLDPSRVGWVGLNEDGERIFSQFPGPLQGYETNWVPLSREDTTTRFVASPYEYQLRWSDTTYTTPNRRYAGYLVSQTLPFRCTNVTTQQACDIFVYDQNLNGQLDLNGDVFVIADATLGVYRFRYQVFFAVFGEQSIAPRTGNTFHIGTTRPFSRQDAFQFTLRSGGIDVELARTELDRILVVPNPYVTAAEWEPRPEVSGRGPRQIQFTHLPEQCTIKIYTIRGELVRTIEHNGVGGDGAEWWDLKTQENQDVAYGVYFYHVSAPGIGEKTGKFALIK